MPQCPYNFAPSRSIASYANEYLLTADEHYERIPTGFNCDYERKTSWKTQSDHFDKKIMFLRSKQWKTIPASQSDP